MQFKLGFGPMSLIINRALAEYASMKQRPLMIIASRNQVDADSGYVMQTQALADQMAPLRSEYLMLCRDHCGPYFLDSERELSIKQAVNATKKTIQADIEAGFDLIHIDTSRCQDSYFIADELFNFCLELNPDIKFEFGTEENVGVRAGVKKYKDDVRFASQYPNMEFVVAQTGSLTMEDRQIGSFEPGLVEQLVAFAEQSNVKLKEHNADYLTADQIQMRRNAGVHACNIAPQLGVIQTQVTLNLAKQYNVNTHEFERTVLESNKWKKWMIGDNTETKILVAGHYCFGSNSYQKLFEQTQKHCDLEAEITKAITNCLDTYYENLL